MVAAGRVSIAPTRCRFRSAVLDCLRPDHLGVRGDDERSASSWIDDLATRSILFESAWAASSWTKGGVPSYLTGLQPAQHGVFAGVLNGDEMFESGLFGHGANLRVEQLELGGGRTRDGREDQPLPGNDGVRAALAEELDSYSRLLLRAVMESAEAEIGERQLLELKALGGTGD